MKITTTCGSTGWGASACPGLGSTLSLLRSGRRLSGPISREARLYQHPRSGADVAEGALAVGYRTRPRFGGFWLFGESRVRSSSFWSAPNVDGSKSSSGVPTAVVVAPAGAQSRRPSRWAGDFFPSFCRNRDTLGQTAKKQQRPIFFRGQGAAAKHKRFPCIIPPQAAFLHGKLAKPSACSTPMAGTLRFCAGCFCCWRAGGCR